MLALLCGLLFLSSTNAQTTDSSSGIRTDVPCTTDKDCAAATGVLGSDGVSVYVCETGMCQVAVGAGYVCSKASDCAQYQWVSHRMTTSSNFSYVVGPLASAQYQNLSSYLESLCAPQYCTIGSTCAKDSTTLFNPNNPLLLPTFSDSQACCAGGLEHSTCTTYGTSSISITSCGNTANCIADPENGLNDLFCTGNILPKSTEWIGIVICILGSACNSVGLNLQALATRNRRKKKTMDMMDLRRKIRGGRGGGGAGAGDTRDGSGASIRRKTFFPHTFETANNLMKRLSTRKTSTSSLTQQLPTTNTTSYAAAAPEDDELNNMSNIKAGHISLQTFPSRSSTSLTTIGGGTDDTSPDEFDHHQSAFDQRRPLDLAIQVPRGQNGRVLAAAEVASEVVNEDGGTRTTTSQAIVMTREGGEGGDEEEEEEELSSDSLGKKLNFGELIRNPIWVLGMVIFISSNLLNFVALQFAPQSLVAPLGSISLVVNVFAAPIINGEKFTWKDIVGGVFIVGGSSMTVIFSGVNSVDYNLCILLKLFQKPDTIVFLTFTTFFLVALFCFIVTVEKNIDPTVHHPHHPHQTSAVIPGDSGSPRHLQPPAAPGDSSTASSPSTQDGFLITERDKQNATRVSNASGHAPLPPTSANLVIQTTTTTTSVTRIKSPVTNGAITAAMAGAIGGGANGWESQQGLGGPSEQPKAVKRRSQVMLWTANVYDDGTRPGDVGKGFMIADTYQDEGVARGAGAGPAEQIVRGGAGEVPFVLAGMAAGEGRRGDGILVIRDEGVSGEGEEVVEVPPSRYHLLKMRVWRSLPEPVQRACEFLMGIKVVPRLRRKISMSSKIVSTGLPLSYAALGGLMGTLTTLFAKSTIHLITNSFLGDNQFDNIYSWLIAGVTVFTAVGQVYWINMGLERYDALLQIPVFFVVWTVFDVIGGGIYFNEFKGFNARQYGLFILAILVIFLGVFVLADRLKKVEDTERKRKQVHAKSP
ncbi:hypothetical protein HDU98_000693 [Podochytrium sp. JEL0797]|nr:hypothetical protein HDU98_000693 [Podochytrium sp. JEL0797]